MTNYRYDLIEGWSKLDSSPLSELVESQHWRSNRLHHGISALASSVITRFNFAVVSPSTGNLIDCLA